MNFIVSLYIPSRTLPKTSKGVQEEPPSRREHMQDRVVVAYYRGPYCVWSGQAVQVLQKHGFQARHLTDGVLDWRARGFRVSAGDKP
jgi:rhodanese-related sulfurtransferase